MTNLLKFLLFTVLFTLIQTFSWLGQPEVRNCGRIPASMSCLEGGFEDLEKIAYAAQDDNEKLYETMKAEFLSSPFCEADKVLSDPTQRLNPIIFNNVINELTFITNSNYDRANKKTLFNNFIEKYELSSELESYGIELLNNYEDSAPARFLAMTRLRGLALQELDQVSKNKPSFRVDDITTVLAKKGIFVPNDNGGGECPFIGREAFMKALQGREKLLKTPILANRVSKKSQITIVDYSMPSNQRRMFVIDLESGKVLHNTWAAHGRGDGSQDAGVDGWGSSPLMSNASGSNLSSEGFIIAGSASAGSMYGPNVILDGVDLNNTKLKSRAVVLHGWRTPMHDYVSGKWEWNTNQTKRILPAPDSYPTFIKTDFKNASEDEMVESLSDLRSAASSPDYKLDGTNGCIGVPEANARQLDRKGRNKSQLELLREDLPGSIIMNYSGPEMKSKFF